MIGRVGMLLNTSLVRNGYAMILSAGITSVLGLAFWIIAARIFDKAQVGIGAALLSSMLVLGNLAQLNLGNILNRFLSIAGERKSLFIARSYGAAAVAAVLLASGFVLAVPYVAPDMDRLATEPALAFLFIVSVALWTIFALQDSALAGLRKAVWIPVENTTYSIAKIGVLLILAGSASTHLSILLAWSVPLPLIIAAVNLGIFRHIATSPSSTREGPGITRADIVPFFGWDYVGTLASMTALGLVPLIVLNMRGAQDLAQYHLSWTITYSLYLVGRSMSMSLLAEGMNDRRRLYVLVSDAVLHTIGLLLPAVLAIIGAAYWIMLLFGVSYAEGSAALLRLLALSCLPWSLVTIYLSVARVTGRVRDVAIVQVATLLFVSVLCPLLMSSMGVTGAGLAWLITHSAVATGIVLRHVLGYGTGGIIVWALSLASALARIIRSTDRRLVTQQANPARDRELEEILGSVSPKTGWEASSAVLSLSDVETLLFRPTTHFREEEPASSCLHGIVIKRAASAEGVEALDRYVERVTHIVSIPTLAGLSFSLPSIIGRRKTTDGLYVVEKLLPGMEGRKLLKQPELRTHALEAAAGAICEMHDRTSQSRNADDDWLQKWVIERTHALLSTPGQFMPERRRREAVELIVSQQAEFWAKRPVKLGLGHGDFSPGNILFTIDQAEDCASAPVQVSAIIDWEAATFDAPAGLDCVFLALSSRAHETGEELGQIVSGFLHRPVWSGEDEAWLRRATPRGRDADDWVNDPEAARALCGLAWLYHIEQGLRKSQRYKQSPLWLAWNVQHVLQAYLDAGRRC